MAERAPVRLGGVGMKWMIVAALAVCLPAAAMAQGKATRAKPATAGSATSGSQQRPPPPIIAPPVSRWGAVDVRPEGETTVLPQGTRLVIALDEQVDSYQTARGARFRVRLVEPVKVGDVILLPAGITGEGEVIHSEPAGDGGRPGELHLAARFLRYGARQIPLKGWRITEKGEERVEHGWNSITYVGYPAVARRGLRAEAELAADFDLYQLMAATPPQPTTPTRLLSQPAGLLAPAPGKAQIVFYRPGGMNGMLNWTKIRFGPGKGAEIGSLGTGGYITIDVPPGRHEFMVSQELGDELYLDAEAGETYYVAIRVHTGTWAGHPNLYPVDRPTFEAALGSMSRKKSAWKGG